MPDQDNGSENSYILTCEELADLFQASVDEIKEQAGHDDLIMLPGGKTGILPRKVKSILKEKGFDYSRKVISHINMRGGIGKTTATISLATRAKQYGFKTCIIDMDPQGSASLVFNIMPEDDDPVFYDVWQKPEEMTLGTIRRIDENLYILPSSLENGLLDSVLGNPASQKKAVSGVCDVLKDDGFEIIIIDNPPSLGSAVISSICASDIVVVPMFSDAFSFRGLEITLDEINSICDVFNLRIPTVKALFSKYDKRERASEMAFEKLKESYSNILIPHVIRTTTEFSKALERRETVFGSSRKNPAKQDYDMYARYILNLNGYSNKDNV